MNCCDITVGELTRKIALQRATKVKNNGGGYTYNWSTYATPYARIKPKTGVERVHAGQLEATNYHQVVIRFNDAVLPDDRILYKNKYYQIRSIINIDEADLWTEILAQSGVVT